MNIAEMHWEFLRRLNKVDSQQNTRFPVPVIDQLLNEAIDAFVRSFGYPRSGRIGVEGNQRAIDDFRTLIEKTDLTFTSVSDYYQTQLPPDYRHFVKGVVSAKRGDCRKRIRAYVGQYDDLVEESSYTRSSLEWEEANIFFAKDFIRIWADFTPEYITLDYLRKPAKVYNAAAYGGTYKDFNGNVLFGTQNCDLPENTHSEIVDLAVLSATNDISPLNYNLKKDKLITNVA